MELDSVEIATVLARLRRLGEDRERDVALGGSAWADFKDWLGDDPLDTSALSAWLEEQPSMAVSTADALRATAAAVLGEDR